MSMCGVQALEGEEKEKKRKEKKTYFQLISFTTLVVGAELFQNYTSVR